MDSKLEGPRENKAAAIGRTGYLRKQNHTERKHQTEKICREPT